jgi:putative oxidoreductase
MTTATHSAHPPVALPGLSVLTGPVARGLLAFPFVVSGAMHFVAGSHMAAAVPSWVPGGVLWVYLTGVFLLAGGLGMWTRRLAVPAAVALAALMLVFALTVHLPAMGNEATQQMAMVGFFKDLGLAGGLLAFAGLRASTSKV